VGGSCPRRDEIESLDAGRGLGELPADGRAIAVDFALYHSGENLAVALCPKDTLAVCSCHICAVCRRAARDCRGRGHA